MTAAEIIEENVSVLPEYIRVPISFQVKSRFRVEPVQNGLGGLRLIEEPVVPYIKDYDALESPVQWLQNWDIVNWGVLSAFVGKQRVGGAVIAWKTEGVDMLGGREDLAVLWDLRVSPDFRGKGLGRTLFDRAVDWMRERDCVQLYVETQNINVPACRFYARQGCELGAINRFVYKDLDEIQLLWYKNILLSAEKERSIKPKIIHVFKVPIYF